MCYFSNEKHKLFLTLYVLFNTHFDILVLNLLAMQAQQLMISLITLCFYYFGDDRDGSKQSVIMLAYQIVSRHRKEIQPAAMHRYESPLVRPPIGTCAKYFTGSIC